MIDNVMGRVEFSLYIEELKKANDFETYLETVCWFIENETDMENSEVVKNLSRNIIAQIEIEAVEARLIDPGAKPVNIEQFIG